MLADLPSKFVWPHEDNPQERLLLDPLPQEEMNRIMLRPMFKASAGWWLVVGILTAIVAVCFVGVWAYMIRWGMGIAGIRRPVFWGMFIATFVFWIGISHSGTFVSAILRVFNAEYRRPITRAAELMTTFSLICAAMYPFIHLGRVWTVYGMIPMPNSAADLAQLPVAVDVGPAGDHDLPHRQHALCVLAADPRPGDGPRSHHRLAAHALQMALVGLARPGIRMALPAQGDPDFCFRDHPGHVLRAHHRVVGLRDDQPRGVA